MPHTDERHFRRGARFDVADDRGGVHERPRDDLIRGGGIHEPLGARVRRVNQRTPVELVRLQLGRRVAAIEAGQTARVTLADEQPLTVRTLQRTRLIDVSDRDDARRATSSSVCGEREGAEYVDDDGDTARAACTFDEVGYADTHIMQGLPYAAELLPPLALRWSRTMRLASAGRSLSTTTFARLKKLKSVALAQV